MQFRMNWKSVRFDWNRARAFLVTAEEGSLSAAARALGMAQPTLGRQVAALEDELGLALFDRSGRGLTLTPNGLELVEHVRAMGEAATRVSRAASGKSQEIAGPICITASEIYAVFLLPRVIAQLRADHPGLEIEIVAANEIRDLRRREADIAVRNTRPSQPDLIARKVADDTGWFYAAPAYLDRIGRPETPADMARTEILGFERSEAHVSRMNAFEFGLTGRNFPIVCQNHLLHVEYARRGLGIGMFPEWLGEADPGLERVLPAHPPISFPIWLVAHRDVNSSRRVRLVFDVLARALSDPGHAARH